MHGGVELTAYLVNESRVRRPELARDPLAGEWIPPAERAAVRDLWEEYAETVYPHDDLVTSLRCRCIMDTLTAAVRDRPDTVLVACGAGFTSYPWLLPFPAAVEVDLPRIAEAKRRRAGELAATGILPARQVTHLAVDLADSQARDQLVVRVRAIVAGRPVAYLAEGMVYYLPAGDARAVAGLGAALAADPLSLVSYWPAAQAGNRVLAAQRGWFQRWSVPPAATYLTFDELSSVIPGEVADRSPEDLQRLYLGRPEVAESALIPEHVAVGTP